MKEANRKLLIEQSDRKFSYRVGALIYREGKILVRRLREEGQYTLPGGHPEWGENSKAALARKVQEETGAAVNVGRLCIVAELFFEWEKPCHQIQFFYLAELKNKDALPAGAFPVYDSLGQPMEDLEFCWLLPEELEKCKLIPRCIRPYLKNLPDQIIHLQDTEGK